MRILGVIITFFTISMIFSCSDSTSIGAEIIEQDQANIQLIDTFTLLTSTIKNDSLIVYQEGSSSTNYLCGNLEDPVFGNIKADLFMQLRISTVTPPNFGDNATLDSVVLRLEYNKAGFYGDTLLSQNYNIHKITNNISKDTTLYDFDALETEETAISSFELVPNFTDSIIIATTDSTSTKYAPHANITLPNSFGEELMAIDSSLYDSNEDFLSAFGGLAIKADNSIKQMASFNITSSLVSGLFLYYKTEDTVSIPKRYIYDISSTSVRFANFDNQPSSEVSDAISGGSEAGKQFNYLQGMNGTNISIKIPHISSLKDVIINNAELNIVGQSQDEEGFEPVEQILVSYKNSDGNLILIDDFIDAFGYSNLPSVGGSSESFTGNNGETLQRYKINIASHLRRMIDNEESIPNEIFLTVYQRAQKANGITLFGTEHPEYPAKLKIHLTNLN